MNATELKELIDSQITNETVDFAISNAEVGERMKDIVDYTTETNFLKTVKITLTQSQIANIFSNPIIAVPAVVGKLLVVRHIFQKYNFNTTQYTPSTFRIGYGNPNTAFISFNAAIPVADDAQGNNAVAVNSSLTGVDTFIGLPLVVGATTANPTGGDGTLDLYVTYYEISI